MSKVDMVHIGLPKTGTTYLQQEVFPRLPLNILSYENISADAYGNFFCPMPHINVALSRLQRIGTAKELYHYVHDVPILIILRSRYEWLKSIYNQMVKRSLYGFSYEYFLKHIDPEIGDFSALIMQYQHHFSDVRVMHYEHFKNDNQGFVDDICSWLEIDPIIVSKKRINRSMNTTLLSVKRLSNRIYVWLWDMLHNI